MLPSYLEVEKNGSQLFRPRQTLFAAIWRKRNVDTCYLETKICSSKLLGARKKIMTSIYSQKTGSQQLEARKNFSNSLEVEKTGTYLFRACQILLQLFGEIEKWIPAICRLKKQFATVRSKVKYYVNPLKSVKLVHRIRSTKNIFPSYLEVETTGFQLFRA